MKAKLVCESINDILKPSELGIYIEEVFQHMVNVGFNVGYKFPFGAENAFKPHQKDYIIRMFNKGQDSKKTAYTILDYILDGESNKPIIESMADILKPVGMEFAIGGKKYYDDVWYEMVSSAKDLTKEIGEIIDTDIQILKDIQFLYMKNYIKIGNNYKNGISAEDTAKQILGLNEEVSDVLKPQDPKVIKDFQNYMIDVLKNIIELNDNDFTEELRLIWSYNKKIMENNFKSNISSKITAEEIFYII